VEREDEFGGGRIKDLCNKKRERRLGREGAPFCC